MKLIFSILFLSLGVMCFSQTHTSAGGGGDWNNPASWDIGVPVTGADVVIATGDVITISGPVTNDDINSLVIQGTGTLSYTGSETIIVATSITMSGTSRIIGSANAHRIDAATFNVPSGTAEIGGIQINVSGNTTTSAGTTLIVSSTAGTKTFTNLNLAGALTFTANESLIIAGNLQMSGTSSIGGAGNGLVDVTGTFTIPSGTATIGGSQLRVNGLATISGNMVLNDSPRSKSFVNLTIDGAGNINFTAGETLTISGVLTMSGTSSITGSTDAHKVEAATFNVTSGTAEIGGIQLKVSGTTTVSAGTVLLFSSTLSLKNLSNLVISGSLNFTADETLTIAGNLQMTGTSSIGGAANGLLNVTGTFTVPSGTATIGGCTINITGLTTISGNIVLNNSSGTKNFSAFTMDGASNINFTDNETLSIAGNLIMSGTASLTGSSNDHALVIAGTFTVPAASDVSLGGVRLSVNTGTTTISGTMTLDNTLGNKTFNNFIIDNAGEVAFTADETLSIAGNLTMSGTSSITGSSNEFQVPVTGDFSVPSGTATIAGVRLTVNGSTTATGTLTFTDPVGTKTFTGDVTINGIWNNTSTSNFTFAGNITNNGTWTGCSSLTGCDYTLTSAGGTISGTGDIDFANLIVSNSISNEDNLTINNNLSGAGTFTNNGVLTLNHHAGTPSYTAAVMDLNNPGSQVILTGNTSDIIEIGPFFDLEISMDPGVTNTISTSSISVENNLDIFSGTLEVLSNTLSVTGNVDIDGGELLVNSVGSVVNAGADIILTSGEYDQNNGDVNITENLQVLSGVFDLAIGAGPSTIDAVDMSITTSAVALNGGDLTLTGGLTQNSGSLLVEGTDVAITAAYNISGGTTDFNSGSLSAASFDIGAGLEITVGNVDFIISGASNIDGTITFDSGTGIRSFGDITVNATGTWSNNTSSDFTISGNIISDGNDWIGCSNTDCDYTLTSASGTISGDTQIDMSDIIIGGGASYENTAILTVSDRLTGAGEFINGVNAGFRYQGDNSTGANFDITTFTASAIGNEVKYNGSTDQQLRATSDNTYYNLTITTNATGDDLTMTSSESVTNELTLTTGIIIMGDNTLTLTDGGSVVGGDGNSYLRNSGTGVFKVEMSAIGTYFAPVGGAFYSPITLDITAATIGGSASLDFSVTDSAHPQRDRDNTADVPAGDDDGTAATDFLDVYWTVAGNNITDPVYDASYIYDASDFMQTTESNMVGALYRPLPPGFVTLDWLARGTVNASNNTVTYSNADGFGDLYAMDNTASRLPIVLISFEAKASDKAVLLKWVTAAEENNQFFTIERSKNGIDFEPLIFIEGAGTTNDKMEYEVIDEKPLLGRSYYKLKQTDFNGQFEYSEMVRVIFEGEDKFEFGLNSNPVNQGESITIWKTTSLEGLNPLITIRDIQGKELVRTNLSSLKDSGYQIPSTNHLSAGIYLLSVNYLGETHTKKVIVK